MIKIDSQHIEVLEQGRQISRRRGDDQSLQKRLPRALLEHVTASEHSSLLPAAFRREPYQTPCTSPEAHRGKECGVCKPSETPRKWCWWLLKGTYQSTGNHCMASAGLKRSFEIWTSRDAVSWKGASVVKDEPLQEGTSSIT